MATLAELKAQNEAEEKALLEAEQTQTEEIETEVSDEEDTEVITDEETAPLSDEEKDPETSEENTAKEAWMVEESDDPHTDEQVVPLSAHINKRRELKGKIEEKDSQIEELRAEIEALKSNKAPQAAPVIEPKRPDPLDFDSDSDYHDALDKYYDDRMDQRLSLVSQTNDARARQESVVSQRNEAVDAHYERASKLVGDFKISPKAYQDADAAVRTDIDSIMPGQGDAIVDELISRLGDGSEKVMYYLGKNPKERALLVSKFAKDKTGLDASIYMGELKAKIATAQTNNTSRAPEPAARPNGQAGKAGDGGALQRKWKKAHDKDDPQAAYEIKKQARTQGIDTKDWK